ncbi:MAG TPA: phenylacetate--CoA ligase family protein [Patescibacteria group bacterium]|nr:phenylacetate--CoA ligase family protein [Patescibacteria group bacterium]
MLLGAFKAFVLYPLSERYERRHIRDKLCLLRADMAEPFSTRRKRRLQRLAEVAGRAEMQVPYYRNLFRSLGFNPGRLAKDDRWLSELPLLTKDIVAEQGWRMLAEGARDGILHERKTGGSTGAAIPFFYSADALDWSAAAHFLAYEWTGKHRHHSEVHLSSLFPETFPWRDRLKEWCKCMAMNRTNVVTSAFSPDSLEEAWSAIRRARPALLQGHPSTLYALALHLRATGRTGGGAIGRFQSTGEVLDPRKRQTIEQVIGCPVFDFYGNAEIGVIAQQTAPQAGAGLKVLDSMVWPEISENGEIVVTSLRNDAMPLLRYVTGDLATLEERADGFFMSAIQGRVHDLITINGVSHPTHYLQDLLDRIGGIDEFQVMERAGQPPLLQLVVPNPDLRAAHAARIAGWWGDGVEVAFVDLAGLHRVGRRNKFRYKVTV